jgi:hypothetical protein
VDLFAARPRLLALGDLARVAQGTTLRLSDIEGLGAAMQFYFANKTVTTILAMLMNTLMIAAQPATLAQKRVFR